MKKFYESKTFWVGALQILSALLMLVVEFLNQSDFSPVAFVMLGNGIVMIVLRFLTSEGIVVG